VRCVVSLESIKIAVERLQQGMHIRLPVKWNDHPFLLNSFKIKSNKQIEMIRHLGIKFVHITPSLSDAVPLPPEPVPRAIEKPQTQEISLETDKMWQEKQRRIEELGNYRRKIARCEKEFEQSMARMRSLMSKIKSRPLQATTEAQLLIENIVEKLLSEDDVTLHLVNSKSDFEDIYFHSLNVAVISMMIGRMKGFSAVTLKELAFSALFHDLGKTKIPTAILRKTSPLTGPELNYYKLHTKYGLDMANSIEDCPQSAKTVSENSH
jgi:HD-GYP domain-containing protein (c-di-GMP phosphodiesterase class II)